MQKKMALKFTLFCGISVIGTNILAVRSDGIEAFKRFVGEVNGSIVRRETIEESGRTGKAPHSYLFTLQTPLLPEGPIYKQKIAYKYYLLALFKTGAEHNNKLYVCPTKKPENMSTNPSDHYYYRNLLLSKHLNGGTREPVETTKGHVEELIKQLYEAKEETRA